MKALSPDLAAHLASGATTLCWCWRVVRRDGVVLGFTDHDRALTFDGTTYEAASGFTASDINRWPRSLCRQPRGDRRALICNADRRRSGGRPLRRCAHRNLSRQLGRYEPARADALGKHRRGAPYRYGHLRPNFAGSRTTCSSPKGRLLQLTCDADLGDARCTVDLSSPAFHGEGTITAAHSARRFYSLRDRRRSRTDFSRADFSHSRRVRRRA